ncbi:MAG TPA: hypothetical protein VM901_12655 [Bdellovibrionota bacterium]|jgi:hypothetical protein|nr:hypothetical protein [Bdellovibrionota bacterium]
MKNIYVALVAFSISAVALAQSGSDPSPSRSSVIKASPTQPHVLDSVVEQRDPAKLNVNLHELQTMFRCFKDLMRIQGQGRIEQFAIVVPDSLVVKDGELTGRVVRLWPAKEGYSRPRLSSDTFAIAGEEDGLKKLSEKPADVLKALGRKPGNFKKRDLGVVSSADVEALRIWLRQEIKDVGARRSGICHGWSEQWD